MDNVTKYNEEHFATFWEGENVGFLKISEDIQKDTTGDIYDKMDEAWKSRSVMDGEDVLLTRFKDGEVNAKYFSTEVGAGSSVYTVYRKQPGENFYSYVCTSKNGVYSINDYNVKSNHYYHYMVTVEHDASSTSGQPYIEYTIYEQSDEKGRKNYYCPHLSGWMICDIELSNEENVYVKTGNSWFLGYNISSEKVSKNFNINSQETLGRFPKITKGTTNYDSMSFSSLLGRICEYEDYSFTGEGNEEKISENLLTNYPVKVYNYSEKETVDSKDNVICSVAKSYATEMDKLEAWKDFIDDGELKLIRDMKGNAWIAHITGGTSYEISNESNLKQTMVTFDWKEVESLDDISIVREN